MAAEVRSVTVRLDADVAAYMAKMKAAGAVTDEAFRSASLSTSRLNRNLGTTEKRLQSVHSAGRQVSPTLSKVDSDIGRIGTTARKSGPDIDRLSGRLRLLAEGAVTIGPALVGIGAIGVPAITGLAAVFGVAALAGGSLLVAVQGIGDAVSALEAFRLDPTAANLEKAQLVLGQLGPDARAFAMAWQHDALPMFREIRDMAAEGWFPGLLDALDEAEDLAPRVGMLLNQVGQAGAEAIAGDVDSLSSGRWNEFWRFLEAEAPTVITRLNGILGDLAHGAAEMWMAFDPGNDDFLAFVSKAADGFDRWASSSEGREDIRQFLDYAREVGPDVLDFFTSTVKMITQISEAAAPLSGPVLQALSGIADAIATIADSDIGTPLFAGVAAALALNRALLVTQKLTGAQAAGTAAASGGMFAGIVSGTRSARTGVQGLRADFNTLLDPTNKFGRNADKVSAASERMRGRMAGLGKTAAVVAGLALVSTDLGDSFDLTNTASLGLIGTMGGLPGAAGGAALGFVLDLRAANDDLTSSLEAAQGALDSGSLTDMASSLASAREELASFKNEGAPGWLKAVPVAGTWAEGAFDWVHGNQADEGEKQLEQLEHQQRLTEESTAALGRALGLTIGPLDGSARSTRELDAVLQRAQPAMEKLGISTSLMRAAASKAEGETFWNSWAPDLDELTGKIADFYDHLESPEGRLEALGDALTGLGDASMSAADRSQLVGQAIDAYIGPANNAEAAVDALHEQLALLRNELDDDAGFGSLTQHSRDNAQLTRDYADAVKDQMVTMVAAGATEKDLARNLEDSRNKFIESGVAAGFSADEMRKRANAIGLTPKLVQTVFKALHVDEFQNGVRNANRAIKDVPKQVLTELRTKGVPQTTAEVNELLGKYNLTEKQRRAVLRLVDLASHDLGAVLEALARAEKPRTSKVKAEAGQAINVLGLVGRLLGGIKSKEITVTTIHRNVNTGVIGHIATGGYVRGPGTTTSDDIPAMLSDKEYVVKADAVDHYGVDFMHQLNAKMLADGGLVGNTHVRRYAAGGPVASTFSGPPESTFMANRGDGLFGMLRNLDKLEDGLAGLNKRELAIRGRELDRTEKQIDKWADKREELARKEVDADKDRLQTLLDARDAFSDQVAGLFHSDVFDKVGGLTQEALPDNWATMTDEEKTSWYQQFQENQAKNASTGLQQDIFDLETAEILYKQLRDRGFDGPVLRELLMKGDVDKMRAILSLSDEDLQNLENLYNERDRIGSQFGAFAGNEEFGKQIRGVRSELKDSNEFLRDTLRENREMGRRVDRIEQKLDHMAQEIGERVGSVINSTARRGRNGQAP